MIRLRSLWRTDARQTLTDADLDDRERAAVARTVDHMHAADLPAVTLTECDLLAALADADAGRVDLDDWERDALAHALARLRAN